MTQNTMRKVSPTTSLSTQKTGRYIPRIQHKEQQEVHMLHLVLPDLLIKKIASAARKARAIVQDLQSLLSQQPKSTQGLSQKENCPSTSTSKEFVTTGNLLKSRLMFIALSSLFLLFVLNSHFAQSEEMFYRVLAFK